MHVGFGEALEESLVEQLRRGLTKDRMGAKLASIPKEVKPELSVVQNMAAEMGRYSLQHSV